tara:strand:+ start:13752 stop:14402 length:651 start_codon:yes stop_codon:yes gene_type:complete
MLVEYYIDSFLNDQETKETLKSLHESDFVNSILINEHQYRLAKIFFHPNKINIHLDFPLGLSSIAIRLKKIEEISKKSGIISIVAPSYLLVNRKYDKIRREISELKDIIPEETSIRYILDYRKYNHNILVKFCSILQEYGLDTIYPSSAFFLDNIFDNIIASKYLQQKSGIKTIFNGDIWTDEHINLIIKSECKYISVKHMQSLNLLKEHVNNAKQ